MGWVQELAVTPLDWRATSQDLQTIQTKSNAFEKFQGGRLLIAFWQRAPGANAEITTTRMG